jgi:DNA-binding MarR family transcriptional regulator
MNLTTVLTRAREKNLRDGSLHALAILAAHPAKADPLTLGDLAKRIGVSTSAITGLADNLTDLGYAQRRPHKTDRRALILIITKQGRTAAKEITA